jgi:hypothetical protein
VDFDRRRPGVEDDPDEAATSPAATQLGALRQLNIESEPGKADVLGADHLLEQIK